MSSVNTSIDDNIPMSSEFMKKSDDYQRADELQLALFHLRIAESLDSKNMEIKKKVAVLEDKIKSNADMHFNKGLERFKNEQFEEARTEFLTALRYDPNHEDAFFYLKEVLSPQVVSTYSVKNGDTFEKIAEKFYGDKDRGFIIAELNNYTIIDRLKEGDKLEIPGQKKYPVKKIITRMKRKKKRVVKKSRAKVKRVNVGVKKPQNELLSEAKRFFRNGKYEEVIPLTDKILKNKPASREARELRNASYYNMGKSLWEEGEYFKALRIYGNVDPDYRGVQREIDIVKSSMKRQAEIHYQRGRKYFENNELRKAILEWARALTYDPEHKEARMDMERARSILKKDEGEK
jgi:tetratricopeptide (TPR) repeat protein